MDQEDYRRKVIRVGDYVTCRAHGGAAIVLSLAHQPGGGEDERVEDYLELQWIVRPTDRATTTHGTIDTTGRQRRTFLFNYQAISQEEAVMLLLAL